MYLSVGNRQEARKNMKYSIKVNEVKQKEGSESNIRGFATVVFGDSFKITNVAILENKKSEQLFVSMPRYRSSERDENGGAVYKDVCNPVTAEFRDELYGNILKAYEQKVSNEKGQEVEGEMEIEMPEFTVSVTPFEREGSNIRGLARIYIDDSFIVNNVSILEGNGKLFVSMPAYKTKQMDDQGKAIYQDVTYPVTKEFREKLYDQIISEYEKAKEERQEKSGKKTEEMKDRGMEKENVTVR